MDPKYTVIVKDTQFQLTKEQIQFDSPNYFTSCFLGDFKESKEGKQTVSIQRHPVLFELIVDYLTGYDIFPLPQSSLIPTMSPLALLKNLKKDALFYGLDGLCEQVDEQVEQINEKLQAQEVPKSSAAIEYEYYLLVSTVLCFRFVSVLSCSCIGTQQFGTDGSDTFVGERICSETCYGTI
jgi:hypothetical protein